MQAIATFVPRSEIEKDNRALHERINAAEKRLGTMEKRVWDTVASAVSAFGSVVLTEIGLMHRRFVITHPARGAPALAGALYYD